MIYPFIISLLLFTATDWMLKQSGWRGDAGKICLLLLGGSFVWLGLEIQGNLNLDFIFAWLLLHYHIHQIFWGLLNGDPFYLGDGIFDRLILLTVGRAKWMYALTLIASLFVGIDLIIKLCTN